MGLVDLDGRPLAPEQDLIEQYREALAVQHDLLNLAVMLVSDLVDSDGRECDQGGDLHTLRIDSKCVGCRARSFLSALAVAQRNTKAVSPAVPGVKP